MFERGPGQSQRESGALDCLLGRGAHAVSGPALELPELQGFILHRVDYRQQKMPHYRHSLAANVEGVGHWSFQVDLASILPR
jgi:hypothetical protein